MLRCMLAIALGTVPQERPAEVRGPGIVVELRGEHDRALAERIVAHYGEIVAVCRLRLGRAPGGEVRVGLARLDGGGNHPGATVGVASWSDRWIQIDPDRLGPTAPLASVLAHEVTHVVVGEASRGRVPAWFDEGVAEWMGSAYGIADRRSVLEAAARGRLPSLADLTTGFPGNASARHAAYAASREVIALMVAEQSQAALGATLRDLATGRPFAEALTAATGRGPEGWDERLAAEYASGPGLVGRLLAGDPSRVWWLLLGLAGLLAIAGAVVRTRRARRKLAATEPPETWTPDDAMTAHYAEHGMYEPEEDEDDDDDDA